MKKLIKKIVGYKKTKEVIHDGVGFIQGTGLILKVEKTHLFGIGFVTQVILLTEGEWTKKLRARMKADEKQEALSNNRL